MRGVTLGLEKIVFSLPGILRLEMGAGDITVSTHGALEMRLERLDDVNLRIGYAGPGVEIRSMQVRFDDPDYQNEFIEDLRAFLGGDAADEFNYCVDANIALAAAPAEGKFLG
jgi:hypothetical protein